MVVQEIPWYRGTSLTRGPPPLGPFRKPMPGVVRGSEGGERILMGEVPLKPAVLDSRTTASQ